MAYIELPEITPPGMNVVGRGVSYPAFDSGCVKAIEIRAPRTHIVSQGMLPYSIPVRDDVRMRQVDVKEQYMIIV